MNAEKQGTVSLNGLLNGLEWEIQARLRSLIGDIPINDLKSIIRAAGRYEQPVRMRLLYALANKEGRSDYNELVRRARILDWDLEGLRAWIAADLENLPAELVERQIKEKQKPSLRLWRHHYKLEQIIGSKITAEEARLAKRCGGSKITLQAWTLRMARLLLSRQYDSRRAWLLAGMLARSQSMRNRERLLRAGEGFLARTFDRQPELAQELERRLAAKEETDAPDDEYEKRKPSLPPVYDETLSTAHILLDIGNHLPPNIDLEHTQAIIVHGHLMPGQKDSFVGAKYHQLRDVQKNVRNKLGRRFRAQKYRSGYRYLLGIGVIAEKMKSDLCGMLVPLPDVTHPKGRAIAEAWIALSKKFQKK